MRGKFEDLTGQRFGHLTVIERAPNDKNRHAQWVCKCDCGKTDIVSSTALKSGQKSCGCANNIFSKHNMYKSRLYSIYYGMKRRCYNPKANRYERYGGRGIGICDEWRNNFIVFMNWALENGYRDDLTIDRIDNDKGYSPDNCRWATYSEQNKNRQMPKMRAAIAY